MFDTIRNIDLAIHDEGLEQPPSGQHQVLCREVLIFELAPVWSAETSLHCKNVGDTQLIEHSYTCCRLLVLAHGKSRLLETEKVAELRHDVWEDSSGMRLLFEIITIHEDVFPTRMTVQIDVEDAFSLLCEGSHQLFDSKDYRMENLRWIFPAPI